MRSSLLHTIFNVEKMFAFTPPAEVDFALVSHAPSDWEAKLSEILCTFNPRLNAPLEKHIGVIATYTQKKALIEALKIIYCRLAGIFDGALGKISEDNKTILLSKLIEDIEACTAGFHSRVNEAV